MNHLYLVRVASDLFLAIFVLFRGIRRLNGQY